MKRIDLAPSGATPHFIGSWQIEPTTVCNELIEFFESHPENHTHGQTGSGLNVAAKTSTDLAIRPRELELPDHQPVRDYLKMLFSCYQDYLQQWPFLGSVLARIDIGSFNIQRYRPGEHFSKLHAERTTLGTSHRVLAWMTYLNDISDGGSTTFTHQQLDVQPETGKTLIWPAEWTHAHKGNVVNSGTKYIITGWMHFPGNA